MKRIEKEIKNKSFNLIESSLPGIDSLDNIPTKQKNARIHSMIFAPIGAAALLIAAILIPCISSRSSVPTSLDNTVSTSESNTSTPITDKPNNPIDDKPNNPIDDKPNNPINNNPSNHSYSFDLANYSPKFESFNEICYYSHYAYKDETKQASSRALRAAISLPESNEVVEQEPREPYEDYFGRYHYPIRLADDFVFSSFVYFEFESEGSIFLEERIGNGHIYGLALKTNLFDEDMIILKNNEKYYSCLDNGGTVDRINNLAGITYSSHKTIEGFDVIKDLNNMRYITVYYKADNSNGYYQRILSQATAIEIENERFPIIEESVFYDDVTIACSIAELRQLFGLDPNFRVTNYNLKEDKLLYDITQPEENEFTLEEFEETFKVSNGELYLGEDKLLSIDNATKIYASDINKDSYRDIVFETYESSDRRFIAYDAYRNTYLCNKLNSEFLEGIDYYLTMVDNRVVFKVFESGKTDDEDLLDYGMLCYAGSLGMTIGWNNYYDLSSLQLGNVYESDGETPIETAYSYTHKFHSDTKYYIDIYFKKYTNPKNNRYPKIENSIVCEANCVDPDIYNDCVSWKHVYSYQNNYRYELSFSQKGSFSLRFRYKGFYSSIIFETWVDLEEVELVID